MHSNQAAVRVYREGPPNQLPLGQMNQPYHSATLSAYPPKGVLQPLQQAGQPVSSVVYVGAQQRNHDRSIFYHKPIANLNDLRRNGRYLNSSEVQGFYASKTFPRLSEVRCHDVFPVATYSGLPTPKSVCNTHGYNGLTLPNHTPRKFVFPHINVSRESSPAVATEKGAAQTFKSASNHVQAGTGKATKVTCIKFSYVLLLLLLLLIS